MMENMSKMMSNMSPEMAEQMGISKDQAAQMSKTMESMSPETMQRVMKWGLKAQSAWQTVKSRKFWMQALVVLFVAMVLGHMTGTF